MLSFSLTQTFAISNKRLIVFLSSVFGLNIITEAPTPATIGIERREEIKIGITPYNPNRIVTQKTNTNFSE
jgi:hypothetical protein